MDTVVRVVKVGGSWYKTILSSEVLLTSTLALNRNVARYVLSTSSKNWFAPFVIMRQRQGKSSRIQGALTDSIDPTSQAIRYITCIAVSSYTALQSPGWIDATGIIKTSSFVVGTCV